MGNEAEVGEYQSRTRRGRTEQCIFFFLIDIEAVVDIQVVVDIEVGPLQQA